MASDPDNISSKLSFEGDAAVLVNKGSIELEGPKAGAGDGFNFKKNKESFKESDATSTDNYLQFAKQLQNCDQGDTHSVGIIVAKRRDSKDSKDCDSIERGFVEKDKFKGRGNSDEMNVNSLRNMPQVDPKPLRHDAVYQHIRQYNILMEDTNTAMITEGESPWENHSKSKVSMSRISPQPNLDDAPKRVDTMSGEDCNPYEMPQAIKRKDRPAQLIEDFSDMTEEVQTFKRRVMSNQNSTKKENIIDIKPYGATIDKPRTFTDQLRSMGATPMELSDDPQSPNSLIRFGRLKQNPVRDRYSECTKNYNREQQEEDIDFGAEDGYPDALDKNEGLHMMASDISPHFPAKQYINSDNYLQREMSDDKMPHQGIEDEVMHQFTFKGQFTSPQGSPENKNLDHHGLEYLQEEDLQNTNRINETAESSKFC